MKVRMVTSPNTGQSSVTELTVAEADAIISSAFMRPGHVVVEYVEGGCRIVDDNGVTLFTVIE